MTRRGGGSEEREELGRQKKKEKIYRCEKRGRKRAEEKERKKGY